jgi:murein DD-endopeptidase MepM/ murein hydrolase activator NlpD
VYSSDAPGGSGLRGGTDVPDGCRLRGGKDVPGGAGVRCGKDVPGGAGVRCGANVPDGCRLRAPARTVPGGPGSRRRRRLRPWRVVVGAAVLAGPLLGPAPPSAPAVSAGPTAPVASAVPRAPAAPAAHAAPATHAAHDAPTAPAVTTVTVAAMTPAGASRASVAVDGRPLSWVPAAPAPPVSPPAPGAVRPNGRFDWPLRPRPVVGRPFRPPSHPYGPGHRGADLVGGPGLPVTSAGDGVVLYAGQLAGRGVVSVRHAGGLRTTYEPVSPSVRAGRVVHRGEPLGTLLPGHPGCPAAACLHWGLLRERTYLDPLLLVRATAVRLLPWTDPPGTVSRPAG